MITFTVNAGSSSLKAHLIDGDNVLDSTAVDEPPASAAALRALDELIGRIKPRIDGVGHRLVHGGPELLAPALVTSETLASAERAAPLAPLHVPPALALLDRLRDRLPNVPQVLCPDTAFHADLPDAAATYPVPAEWRRRHGLRRYGFHGLSYAWALGRAAATLERPASQLRLLMAHLGGGCSVCAVARGRSVDTSMGFTPLEGLVMSTRSGSVDPGMLLWLLRHGGLGLDELEHGLSRESGLLGLSDGRSADTRDLVAARADDPAAELALQVFAHRAARELAAAATSLERVDAIVFTGEIGYGQPELRSAITARLTVLGAVPCLVVAPREDLQLHRETASVIHRVRD